MSVPFQEDGVLVLALRGTSPVLTKRYSAEPVSYPLIYPIIFLYVEFE